LKSLKQLIPGAKVEGDFIKSREVTFKLGQNLIKRKEYSAECSTVGSIHLISQMLLPCLLFQEEPECKLTITGGTIVNNSPPAHSYEHTLLPMLRNMGVGIDYKIKNHGLYPDTKGKVELTIKQ
jgi:RNA 3'-terminal phosphate cyclase (ATP)